MCNLLTYLLQIPAEARDDLQVTADDVRADTMSDDTTPSIHDGAAAEDDLQCADDIAAEAGSSNYIQEYVTNSFDRFQSKLKWNSQIQ